MASLGFLFFLFACTNSAENADAEKYKQGHRDVLTGIETGDSTKFSILADDAVDHTGPMGAEISGAENIKRALIEMKNHVKDMKFDIKDEVVSGDYLYVWSTMSGTALDNSMGVAPGTSFKWTGVDIVRFKDGKAAEHWGYVNPADMMPPAGMDSMSGNPMDTSSMMNKPATK